MVVGTGYMFIDEAGDYDFRPGGGRSKYLIWGSVIITGDPYILYTPFSKLKHRLNSTGVDLDRFHASEDRQWVRDKVFEILSDKNIPFKNDFVVVKKCKANSTIRDPVVLYPKMAYYLLRYIFNRHHEIEKIVIFTDTLPVRKKRRAIEKSLKGNIKKLLPNKEFHIYHHSSRSNFGLQAIDYCAWAVYRKWESDDLRSYKLIQAKIKSEFDIFRSGEKRYY